MSKYNWQQPDWPHFTYDLAPCYKTLTLIAEKMGSISSKLNALDENLQLETVIDFMVDEAVNTSKIEGENINRFDIRSSIKNNLGLNKEHLPIHDKRAQGVADLMLAIRKHFKNPLSEKELFEWHSMLFSFDKNQTINIGHWRTDQEGDMRIISGYQGKITVHFEAPPANIIANEMKRFIIWFNKSLKDDSPEASFPPVRAAIAHLYFESIHPFDDGNGRIGRAIAEKALSQSVGRPLLLNLSKTIEENKKNYYNALHAASKKNDITDWLIYFVSTVLDAQVMTENQIDFILKKSIYFKKHSDNLNERQLKVIKRMLREGIKGFSGGLSAKKYMAITGTSKATATRDLQALHKQGALIQTGSGLSVRYQLAL